MDQQNLVAELAKSVPRNLAEDLVETFLQIRVDVATSTLGRAAPGKFVETVVQIFQHLAHGKYDAKPKVDEFLRKVESQSLPLDDGLRICGARIARAMYSLRSKRNIAHKGEVDPNNYDLRFLLAGAQWTLAELVRLIAGLPMEEAGRLVERINAPVGGLVEDFGDKRLVHGNLTVHEELLVLMHSYYPTPQLPVTLVKGLDRRSAGTVRNEIRALWKKKLCEGTAKHGYRLTKTGLRSAIALMRTALDSDTAP